MINEYLGIVDYYDKLFADALIESHKYKTYRYLAEVLSRIFGDRKKILEIGVGTGLVFEKLLPLGEYELTGIDFSSKMVEIARKKLSNFDVNLVCADATKFESEDKFQAVFSNSGVIYIIKEEGEYRLYSHILDLKENKKFLRKLYNQLDDSGVLALAIQEPHINQKSVVDDDGNTYETKILLDGSYVDKQYIMSQPNGGILGEQFCRFYFWNEKQTRQLLSEAGFKQERKIVEDSFWVSYK